MTIMQTTQPYPIITLTVAPQQIKRLATLLQRGFLIPCPNPVALETLLLGLPGFNREYIHNRIETIFINGSAADSLAYSLEPGSTVALSAAMPGLAGAIFRKGGPHAGLRTLPPPARSEDHGHHEFVTLKLFNMVADDTVQPLLCRGILMKHATLARFFRNRAEQLQHILFAISINSTMIPLNKTVQLPDNEDTFLVRAKTDTANG
ncbi:MAG: hypothetical protein DSY57_05885 [Desulfobulbus sp.]|nr:MAG: hypothetical protein DSY57_05885 [Desulfobulbus sp.]